MGKGDVQKLFKEETQMSEPMDLEKANIIIIRCLDEDGNMTVSFSEFENEIAKGIASERQRMIEKFSPVVEALEYQQSAFDKLVHKVPVTYMEEALSAGKNAIKLFREIEKQG